MPSWSLYRHEFSEGSVLAVLEQRTDGSFWFTEDGEPFTVPVPSTNVCVDVNWPRPTWGHDDPPPPPEPVPYEITMQQARLAIHYAGLSSAVNAALNNLPEPDKTTAAITWEFSAVVQRDYPLMLNLANALGLSSEQVDELFRVGSRIR